MEAINDQSLTIDEIWDILSKTQEKDLVIIEFDTDSEKIDLLCKAHIFMVCCADFEIKERRNAQTIYLESVDGMLFNMIKGESIMHAILYLNKKDKKCRCWHITRTRQYESMLNHNILEKNTHLLVRSIISIPKRIIDSLLFD
jgi:hypothetical protein